MIHYELRTSSYHIIAACACRWHDISLLQQKFEKWISISYFMYWVTEWKPRAFLYISTLGIYSIYGTWYSTIKSRFLFLPEKPLKENTSLYVTKQINTTHFLEKRFMMWKSVTSSISKQFLSSFTYTKCNNI